MDAQPKNSNASLDCKRISSDTRRGRQYDKCHLIWFGDKAPLDICTATCAGCFFPDYILLKEQRDGKACLPPEGKVSPPEATAD